MIYIYIIQVVNGIRRNTNDNDDWFNYSAVFRDYKYGITVHTIQIQPQYTSHTTTTTLYKIQLQSIITITIGGAVKLVIPLYYIIIIIITTIITIITITITIIYGEAIKLVIPLQQSNNGEII